MRYAEGAGRLFPPSSIQLLRSTRHLKPTPIFDTNVFSHVERGLIKREDWRTLLRHRPRKGWRLSSVTALELLAGIETVPFANIKNQLNLAFDLSNGRILDDPRHLICSEVLRIPLPAEFEPFGHLLTRYLDVARHATSKDEILRKEVRYKSTLTHGRGRAGFPPNVITDVVEGPKRKWKQEVERILTQNYPNWREHFMKTGKRMPADIREVHKPTQAWDAQRALFGKSFLEWVHADPTPENITDITARLSAAIDYTTFVAREVVINNYSVEKHDSDVYDQFQLLHLALDRFVIVTADPDLSKRTARSPQANRIMSFQQFLDEVQS